MTLLLLLLLARPHLSTLAFEAECPSSAYQGMETVSAVVYLSKRAGSPMNGPDWFHPEPCYSAKFSAKAGDALIVQDDNSVGFPVNLAKLEPGTYTVQAVIDRNLGGRAIAASPGNYFSDPVEVSLDPEKTGTIKLACTNVVAEPVHADTDRIKYVKFPSKLLSSFYGRPTFIKAAVALPSGYLAGGVTHFPTVYEVPGFGGSVDNDQEVGGLLGTTDKPGQSFISVLLDPNVPTGHSVFADSANNGPWGTALTEEFIPYLERNYQMISKPSARFVTGHSSGGWSSLWLQVSHPDFFGGVWSSSPDPVDFTDFQMIDIYKPGENMFSDSRGNQRPLARNGSQVLAYYKAFSDMERPIRGEQLGSFEAVFSPKGADGKPESLWDRDTGRLNPKVAEAWKKYDIDLILKTNWSELEPKLKGKIHVYCGSEDTFYLDGAVRKLKATMVELGSDASIELFPGNHFTVLTRSLRDRIAKEMVDQFESHNKS